VDLLKKELLKRDIIHCDETPVQVLKEPGKAPQTKSYMWLYRSGNDGRPPVVLYDYQSSRGGKNAGLPGRIPWISPYGCLRRLHHTDRRKNI
jgi:transposase